MEEKKKILIVEDERAIVEILKFNLAREGYETLEALDGEAGLQLGLTGDPDLILLDVMLPKMNGFDICAKLRRRGQHRPHHYADGPRGGDGQGFWPGGRGGRLYDEAFLDA